MTREEAIKIVRNIYQTDAEKEALATLIPELAESEDERIIRTLQDYVKNRNWPLNGPTQDEVLAYLEKQKDASKAIEAVDRIDKYIDEHLANAHDMKDSNPDKKYYRGWDDALGEMARILQDVYSGEKQKELQPVEWEWPNLSNCIKNCKKCLGKCFYRKEPYERQKQECGEKGLKGPQEIGDWRGDEGVCKKQKEQNGEDEECTDFTIYYPLKNGKGEYECIPYSFYDSLTFFSEDKDLIDFHRACFYTEEECNEWIEQHKEEEGYEAIPVESTLEYKLGFKAGKESEKQKESLHVSETCKENTDSFTDEDERMRKRAIAILKQQRDYWSYDGPTHKFPPATTRKDLVDAIDAALSYLEKQKEQKLAHTAKEMWKEMRLEVYAQASGNRHEPNCSDNSTKMFSLYDIDEIFEKIGNTAVGSQPTEWGDEDSDNLERVDNYLWMLDDYVGDDCAMPQGKTDKIRGNIQGILSPWLKNLPKRFRPQPKQEWSEEETKDLVHILKVLDDCYAYGKHDLSKTDHDNLTSMIKSLRPSWKPSEEQIKYLLMLADYFESEGGTSNAKTLREFSEDLRKLI